MGILDEFLDNKHGVIIISVVWGLGLATLFRKVCKGRNCIVIKAPDPEKIKNNIYNFENKCYKFYPEIASCKKNI